MFRTLVLTAAVVVSGFPSLAGELIQKASPHSVTNTMDRLEAAVTGAGATVFVRVDHAAGASKVDMELPDAQLLIFGNPKLGTPAMQADMKAGLDLPLRVLVHADENGATQVVYRAPSALSEDHAVPADAQVIMMMTGALDKLTNKAVSTD